jgi:hypothetical protein
MDKLTTDIELNDESRAGDKQTKTITEHQLVKHNENSFTLSIDPNQADSRRHKLTETEIFVLSLCLSMILRERDFVMANRLDGTDIHLHFIAPKLANDLDNFIEHAIYIYFYLKNDFDLSELISPPKQHPPVQQSSESADSYSDDSSDDFLSDFLIINAVPGT